MKAKIFPSLFAAIAACGLVLFSLVACSQQSGLAAQSDAGKLSALKDALKSGVITQQEYDAKVAALTGSASAPTPGRSSPAGVTDPAKVSWTTVAVADPIFKMDAFTVTLPADWSFEGAVLRGSCGSGAMYVYRASSPDGLTGVQAMPAVDWYYAQDPRAITMTGGSTCNLHAPVAATKQAAEIAAQVRPNPQLDPVQTMPQPKIDQFVLDTNQKFAQQAATFGQPADKGGHLSAETARIHLRYDYQGHPEEEWLQVQTMIWDLGVSVMGTGRYGIIKPEWARSQHTQTYVGGLRAPQGKLESSKALLEQIQSSVKLVPEYDQAMQAFMQQQFNAAQARSNAVFQQIMKNGRDSEDRLIQQHNDYMNWQNQRRDAQNQQFQQDMARKDGQTKNYIDYIYNQQYYQNPETGQTVTLKNVPGATTPYGSTPSGGWVQLQPISH